MEDALTNAELFMFGVVYIGVVLRAMAYDKEED
jgi:hypothetical protein